MESIHDNIWESALKIIQLRPHSRLEIEDKLQKKYPDEERMINRILKEMEAVQLVNDRRFTEEFVHHLIQKPIGRIRINVEARKKGLDSNIVEQILINEEWNEEEVAKKALEIKKRSTSDEDPRKYHMKLMRFLQSRGFRNEVIYKILAE